MSTPKRRDRSTMMTKSDPKRGKRGEYQVNASKRRDKNTIMINSEPKREEREREGKRGKEREREGKRERSLGTSKLKTLRLCVCLRLRNRHAWGNVKLHR